MIDKEISKKILTIGPYKKDGKGGIAVVVNNFSNYYDPFYFVSSTRSKNWILMFWYFGVSIFQLLYYKIIKRIKIVHIHGSSYGSFARKMILIHLSRWLKIKTIYHIHGSEYRLFYEKYNGNNRIKNTIDKVDVLIVLSKEWKSFFSTITEEKKICIVNNMVDKSSYTKPEADEKQIKFLFLGELGKRKGIFDLLDVIIKKKESWTEKFVFHVGGNGEIEKLKKIVEEEQLHDIVKFEGWVSGNKKKELLSACDIFILPSYNEGLPVSILEAMSYGMPIISTPVGGIPEIIEDYKNGFLINPGDKDALEDKIEYFLDNKSMLKSMGDANLKIIEDFYPESVIPRLNDLYKSLLTEIKC